MLTLKNAMNTGSQLLNQGNGERLELMTSWTIPYQRFDGVLRHLGDNDQEFAILYLQGFYATSMLYAIMLRNTGLQMNGRIKNSRPLHSIFSRAEDELG
jgi:hypothetical protein